MVPHLLHYRIWPCYIVYKGSPQNIFVAPIIFISYQSNTLPSTACICHIAHMGIGEGVVVGGGCGSVGVCGKLYVFLKQTNHDDIQKIHN